MERLEAKRVKGHTYYYYSNITPSGHASTIAVAASGRNTWASWKTSSRPFKGPGRLQFAPRCSSGDCRRPSGKRPRVLGSLSTSTDIAQNAGKD